MAARRLSYHASSPSTRPSAPPRALSEQLRCPLARSPMSATPLALALAGPRRARDEPANAEDVQEPQRKRRLKRATWACERCRTKKLRCTGGEPCDTCRRANIECDFGDRNRDFPPPASERFAQLEQTVFSLISGLSHARANSPLPPPDNPDVSSLQPQPQPQPQQQHELRQPPVSTALITLSSPLPSAQAQPHASPLSQDDAVQVPLDHYPDASESLASRWSAAQRASAPFPALMTYPSTWYTQPAKTSPRGDSTAQPPVGLTYYHANVRLHSEPVAEGILDDARACLLFKL